MRSPLTMRAIARKPSDCSRPLGPHDGARTPHLVAAYEAATSCHDRETRSWRQSISSTLGNVNSPFRTTGLPATIVCRAATGPHRSHASTGSDHAPAKVIPLQRPCNQISARSGSKHPDFAGPAQASSGAKRCHLQHIPCAHPCRALPKPSEQQGGVGLKPKGSVVRICRSIAPQADGDALPAHLP